MNGGKIIQHLDQPVVILLRIVHGDELGGRIQLVKQGVRIRRRRQPLHPAALSLSALRLSLQLLRLAGVGGTGVDGKAAKAATLAVLPITLVDHCLSFAKARSAPAELSPGLLDLGGVRQQVGSRHRQGFRGVDHRLVTT